MLVLEVGQSVSHLQFLPDSRRLLVGFSTPGFEVWTLPGDRRVRLPLSKLHDVPWWITRYGSWVAVHPSGEWCYIPWNGRLLSFRTADGRPRPVPKNVEAHQVVISPDGQRAVTAYLTTSHRQLSTFHTDKEAPAGPDMDAYACLSVRGRLPAGQRVSGDDCRGCPDRYRAAGRRAGETPHAQVPGQPAANLSRRPVSRGDGLPQHVRLRLAGPGQAAAD